MRKRHNTSLTKNELRNIISEQERKVDALWEEVRRLNAQLDIYKRYKKKNPPMLKPLRVWREGERHTEIKITIHTTEQHYPVEAAMERLDNLIELVRRMVKPEDDERGQYPTEITDKDLETVNPGTTSTIVIT